MAIKTTRAGAHPSRRCKAPTYTQAQVDLILHQRMESFQLTARELRQLLMELAQTRQPSRQSGYMEFSKTLLMRVMAKSAELADI
jgi:ribosomal protein L17